ncbi:MAG: glutamine synthetase type III, partial [Clostridia bacterium]|nr:glutamine synthetase type III [Clostridia bacterium]
AVAGYTARLANGLAAKKALAEAACGYETDVLTRLSGLEDEIYAAATALSKAVDTLDGLEGVTEGSAFVRDELIPKMDTLRTGCDEAETLTAAECWPFPTYGELLFGV